MSKEVRTCVEGGTDVCRRRYGRVSKENGHVSKELRTVGLKSRRADVTDNKIQKGDF